MAYWLIVLKTLTKGKGACLIPYTDGKACIYVVNPRLDRGIQDNWENLNWMTISSDHIIGSYDQVNLF